MASDTSRCSQFVSDRANQSLPRILDTTIQGSQMAIEAGYAANCQSSTTLFTPSMADMRLAQKWTWKRQTSHVSSRRVSRCQQCRCKYSAGNRSVMIGGDPSSTRDNGSLSVLQMLVIVVLAAEVRPRRTVGACCWCARSSCMLCRAPPSVQRNLQISCL